MKKLFLLFIMFNFVALNIEAQNCDPDDTLPPDFLGVSPLPADAVEPCDSVLMDTIYLNQPFEFTFTVQTPASFEFQGQTALLNSVTVTSVDGIPDGMEYVCNPADCVYPGGAPGCMKLQGTATNPAQLGRNEVIITTTVAAAIDNPDPIPDIPLNLTITFPPASADPADNPLGLPVCAYAFWVEASSPNQDVINEQLSIGQNIPNPFDEITNIQVNAEAGNYNFSVYNLLGELVHTREVYLNGAQNIEFDGSQLDAGMYIYSFSNENGTISHRMIIE